MEKIKKTKDGEIQFRTLTIEVPEDVAKRLDSSADSYARYGSAADVAAECVRLYFELLERVDSMAEKTKQEVIKKHIKSLDEPAKLRARGSKGSGRPVIARHRRESARS